MRDRQAVQQARRLAAGQGLVGRAALARAGSKVRVTMALTAGLTASIRSMCAVITSRAETSPAAQQPGQRDRVMRAQLAAAPGSASSGTHGAGLRGDHPDGRSGRREGAVGGLVRLCGSCKVDRSSTRTGLPPKALSWPGPAAQHDGMAADGHDPADDAVDGAGGWPTIQAVGTPHMPRMTWVNRAATGGSTMTTEESCRDGPAEPVDGGQLPDSGAPEGQALGAGPQAAALAGVLQARPERGGGGRGRPARSTQNTPATPAVTPGRRDRARGR